MAIASVARKATIRKDDTLFKANQLVQQQKSVAKKLAQQQQKIDADAAAQEASLNSERLKQFYKIDGGEIPQWEQENKQGMENLSNTLLDPSLSGADKDRALMEMHARAGIVKANTESLTRVHSSLVGTEKQKQERNEDAVTKATSAYLDKTGAQDYDETKLQEVLSNTLDTYNNDNSTKNWMTTVQDEVTKSTSTTNVAGGAFTQIDQKTKSAKFLVLNDNGIGFKTEEDGRPTAVLTGESLASYEGYSKGHTLEIDKYIKDNERSLSTFTYDTETGKAAFDKVKPTRLEAMEAILREKGAFNIQETTKTDVKVTPKDDTESAAAVKAAKYKEDVNDRLDFLLGDKANNLAVLKRGRGVVATAEMAVKGKDGNTSYETINTGVEKKDGKTIYTLAVDPNKVETASIVSANVGGGGIPMTVIGEKTAKIQKVTIEVDDKNPRAGLIALSLLYNQTVDAKNRVDTDDIIKEYDVRMEKKAADKAAKDAANEKTKNGFPALNANSTEEKTITLGEQNGFPSLVPEKEE